MIANRKPESWTFSDHAPDRCTQRWDPLLLGWRSARDPQGSNRREQQPQTSNLPGSDVRKRLIASNPMVYLDLRNSCLSFAIAWNVRSALPDTWSPSVPMAMGPVSYPLSQDLRKNTCFIALVAAHPHSVDGVGTR
jgi:hypothetical protein